MKPFRLFKPDNLLAARLTHRRGIDAATAVAAGDKAVAAHEVQAVAEIDRLMAVLDAELKCLRASGRVDASLPDIYRAAESIAGLAGVFRRPELGEAAAGLCALLAAQEGHSPAQVEIYLDAIHLIHRDARAADELLPQLRRLGPVRRRPEHPKPSRREE